MFRATVDDAAAGILDVARDQLRQITERHAHGGQRFGIGLHDELLFVATAPIDFRDAWHNAQQRLEGEPPVEIGVGLHAGEAVLGHIGSSARHDFSAIGDATNVASRIESLTKDAGYRLLCSQVVAQRLPSTAMLTPLGPSTIKGHAPVEVWGYDRL